LTRPRGATPSGELVVSRGDGAVDLQVTDHALDAVALAIHAPVPADFGLATGFGRNAGTDVGLMQAGADGVGIVALFGEKIGGPLLGQGDYLFECRAVRSRRMAPGAKVGLTNTREQKRK